MVVLADDLRFVHSADDASGRRRDIAAMEMLTQIERETTSLWFIDELATAALDVSERPSQIALVERAAPHGAMPPLTQRDKAETYRVLEGEVLFFIGDEVVPARSGDVVVAAADVVRTFRVASEQARWLVLTRVTSLEAYLDFNRAVATVTAEGCPSDDEHAALVVIGAANGIELLGPPGALPGGRKQL